MHSKQLTAGYAFPAVLQLSHPNFSAAAAVVFHPNFSLIMAAYAAVLTELQLPLSDHARAQDAVHAEHSAGAVGQGGGMSSPTG